MTEQFEDVCQANARMEKEREEYIAQMAKEKEQYIQEHAHVMETNKKHKEIVELKDKEIIILESRLRTNTAGSIFMRRFV